MAYYIVVHGGAGFHTTQSEKEVRKKMRRACAKALQLLQQGKNACEAVESAIVELEDSECLNAGYGSNLTQMGTVECDAAIMEDSGRFGSVGAISGVKNPIRVARAILDYSSHQDPLGRVPPLTLVSTGAHDFASASKINTVHPDDMVSSRAQNEWKFWSDKVKANTNGDTIYPGIGDDNTLLQDTVGSVALDRSGNLSAGVSSGGLLLKLPGRVGEAAVFGAGCWAHRSNGEGVATSVSGTGEAIMRASLARTLSDVVCHDDPHEELRQILSNKLSQPEGCTPSAGAVMLVKEMRGDGSIVPRLWCAFNTTSMAIAYASSEDPRPKSIILRQSETDPGLAGGTKPVYLTVLPWTTA